MVWYFYQSQNKLQKRKERLNRGKRKSLPLAWGEAHLSSRPSPTPPTPVVFLPAPPRCSVESHRRHRRHRDAPQPSTCLPGRLLASWRTLRAHPLHFPLWNPLPRLSRANPAKTRAPRSSPPWKPVATFLLSRCHLVQALRRRRLHRPAEGIEPEASEDVEFFLELPPAAVKEVVESAAVEPPQPSPPSRLRSG